MQLSIVTPTYNAAHCIGDTLRSVARQDYPHIEHIVVDGNSRDGTLDVVGRYSHVAQVICEPDDGIYDAMNKGIQQASGDVIAILNADDFYPSVHTVSHVMAALQASRAETLYGDLVYIDAEQTHRVIRYWQAGKFQPRKFIYGWMPPHPTFFVRREVYERYGYFSLDLPIAADYELMLRLLYKHQVSTYYLPEILVKMRTGGVSNANFFNRLQANREDRLAWEINDLQPHVLTHVLKPARKVPQYWLRGRVLGLVNRLW